MSAPTIGSLCSGYGGLDLAVEELFGARTVWHAEYDAAPSKILAAHWPDVPNHRDITTTDWSTVEPIDILTAGYPCQPFSAAGQRKGTDDERHLWPYVRDAIRELRPRYTLLENVAGHRSLGFDRVLGDLAEDGLHARWCSLRASDIGAPHHRERLFILAYPANTAGGGRDGWTQDPLREAEQREAATGDRGGLPANPGHRNQPEWTRQARRGNEERPPIGSISRCPRVAHLPTPNASDGSDGGSDPASRVGHSNQLIDAALSVDFGRYGPAIRRWEQVVGPAPSPTEPNKNGRPRLNATFAEWMMGLPAGWVTDVDGLTRSDQLKAIGNGVVPQQALAAFRWLLSFAALEVAA